MGKGLSAHVEVRGRKAMIYGTILCIVVALLFYIISVIILEEILFFIIAMIFLVITYISNMIKAYKDMKKLEETEGKSSEVEISTYNNFKK